MWYKSDGSGFCTSCP
ncbi:(2Fe-2S)-binding protein [Staphylococcus aureus]